MAKSNYITGQHTKFAIKINSHGKINSQGNIQNLLLKLYSMIPVLIGQHTKFVIEIVLQIYYRAQSHKSIHLRCCLLLLKMMMMSWTAVVEDDDDELNGGCWWRWWAEPPDVACYCWRWERKEKWRTLPACRCWGERCRLKSRPWALRKEEWRLVTGPWALSLAAFMEDGERSLSPIRDLFCIDRFDQVDS